MTLGSSKHLRDIYGLVKIDDMIDMNWLEKEIAARNFERCMAASRSVITRLVSFQTSNQLCCH